MKAISKWLAIPMLAGLLAAGCSGTVEDEAGDKSGIDGSAFAEGKADFGGSAKLIDGIGLDSTIDGEFDPRVRSYGYTFDAKRGASMSIDLTAVAGDDARGLEEGETLDTVMAVYKGYEDPEQVGEKILESDDGDDSVAAPTIQLDVEETGTYFLAFTSYDDTGTGDYSLSLECDGTDLQCQRPNYDKPCEEGELYVQGGEVDEDTTWDVCDIVLMERTRVTEDTILTIKPGVTVKGNFLQGEDRQDRFGIVSLDVWGAVQAVGTEEAPIAFTALKERGWRGIELRGESNTLEHVFIEKADVAVDLQGSATAEVRHSVIEGGVTVEENTQTSSVGIQAGPSASAEFTRALVKGFDQGVRTEDTDDLVVRDAVIRDNERGVVIVGDEEASSCNRGDTSPNNYRDPIFEHVDIVDNEREGIRIEGSDIFVQVTKSNIIDNGSFALRLRGASLAEESHLTENNIFGNNGETAEDSRSQVRSNHRNNTLVLEDNHWQFISDPELSESWNARCDGEISYTGLSPEPIEDAGPRPDQIKEDVNKQSYKQQSPQEDGG